MPKYIIYWRMDPSRAPADPQERMKLFTQLLQMTKKQVSEGMEWGIHAEGNAGYAIFEGSEEDLSIATGLYLPYVICDAHAVLNVDEMMQVLQKMSQAAQA